MLDTSYAAFIKHVRPVFYLPVRLPNRAHCRFAHHLERVRLGIAGRDLAAVSAWADEHAAFYAGLDVSFSVDAPTLRVVGIEPLPLE